MVTILGHPKFIPRNYPSRVNAREWMSMYLPEVRSSADCPGLPLQDLPVVECQLRRTDVSSGSALELALSRTAMGYSEGNSSPLRACHLSKVESGL